MTTCFYGFLHGLSIKPECLFLRDNAPFLPFCRDWSLNIFKGWAFDFSIILCWNRANGKWCREFINWIQTSQTAFTKLAKRQISFAPFLSKRKGEESSFTGSFNNTGFPLKTPREWQYLFLFCPITYPLTPLGMTKMYRSFKIFPSKKTLTLSI